MDMLTVKLDFPRNILGVLDIPERHLGNRLRELIVPELVREGRISPGKGAEMTGTGKGDFIRLMARNGISCFTEMPDDLGDQIKMMEKLLKPEDV